MIPLRCIVWVCSQHLRADATQIIQHFFRHGHGRSCLCLHFGSQTGTSLWGLIRCPGIVGPRDKPTLVLVELEGRRFKKEVPKKAPMASSARREMPREVGYSVVFLVAFLGSLVEFNIYKPVRVGLGLEERRGVYIL